MGYSILIWYCKILQKPFLGGIAAFRINTSSDHEVLGNQKVIMHHGVVGYHKPGQDLEVDLRGQHYHTAVVYEFVLCSAVVIALSLLVLWHVRMISYGETNIEVYINRKEVDRLKKLGLVSSQRSEQKSCCLLTSHCIILLLLYYCCYISRSVFCI